MKGQDIIAGGGAVKCAYCDAECSAVFSPAGEKGQKFPACNWAHAYTALNLELVLPAWRGK